MHYFLSAHNNFSLYMGGGSTAAAAGQWEVGELFEPGIWGTHCLTSLLLNNGASQFIPVAEMFR